MNGVAHEPESLAPLGRDRRVLAVGAFLFEGARHRSRGQMTEFKCDGYTWFHRETGQQEIKTRGEIEKAYDDALKEMR